ncbi:MAG TPA: hypothetical protein VGR56_10930 [Nitrososphaerales archaeon]|nr:hypothetical protein [Nitrososphaerales archaeon]
MRNILLPLSFGCCGFEVVDVGGAEVGGVEGRGADGAGLGDAAARVAVSQIEGATPGTVGLFSVSEALCWEGWFSVLSSTNRCPRLGSSE